MTPPCVLKPIPEIRISRPLSMGGPDICPGFIWRDYLKFKLVTVWTADTPPNHGERQTFLLPPTGLAGCLDDMAVRQPMIAVCGAGQADAQTAELAETVGYELARAGAIVVCGGLGGVMEAACKGAKSGGGTTVGILPGADSGTANQYVDIPIVTGMAQGRNAVIVHTADGVIALPGSFGTLSEIALAANMGKPVVTVGKWWTIPEVKAFDTAGEAVVRILEIVAAR